MQAASNHSAFRFLNQAPKTGAVDIYMVPAGVAIADTVPLVTDLPVGGTTGYVSFTSQTVTMVVTPTGLLSRVHFHAIMLLGGEVRTVLIMDTQLTCNPPVEVSMANDAGRELAEIPDIHLKAAIRNRQPVAPSRHHCLAACRALYSRPRQVKPLWIRPRSCFQARCKMRRCSPSFWPSPATWSRS